MFVTAATPSQERISRGRWPPVEKHPIVDLTLRAGVSTRTIKGSAIAADIGLLRVV